VSAGATPAASPSILSSPALSVTVVSAHSLPLTLNNSHKSDVCETPPLTVGENSSDQVAKGKTFKEMPTKPFAGAVQDQTEVDKDKKDEDSAEQREREEIHREILLKLHSTTESQSDKAQPVSIKTSTSATQLTAQPRLTLFGPGKSGQRRVSHNPIKQLRFYHTTDSLPLTHSGAAELKPTHSLPVNFSVVPRQKTGGVLLRQPVHVTSEVKQTVQASTSDNTCGSTSMINTTAVPASQLSVLTVKQNL